jgi:hypothetical protein
MSLDRRRPRGRQAAVRDPPIEPAQEPRTEPKGQSHAVVPLTFEGHEFRTIDRDGERWWVLADICEANDIGNTSDVARRLRNDEKDTIDRIEGGNPGTRYTIVNEGGLYEAMRPLHQKQCLALSAVAPIPIGDSGHRVRLLHGNGTYCVQCKLERRGASRVGLTCHKFDHFSLPPSRTTTSDAPAVQ